MKPAEETSRIKRLLLNIAAYGTRLDFYLRGQKGPKYYVQHVQHAC